jgi:CRP/FNR family cyclic AMP-dependent transcriptional regulator
LPPHSLSQRHLDLVARHADEVSLDAGRVLARQGGLGREFLLIVDGSARVERDGRRIAHLGPGDCFGEMSLIDGRPRSATVVAETPMVLLCVHTRSFGYLLDTVPGLRKKILVTLCQRLRAADAALGSRN